jgi:hypothetical protein
MLLAWHVLPPRQLLRKQVCKKQAGKTETAVETKSEAGKNA